ncbi:MAG TPA: hypothetical protein VFV38_28680 [Ktedonobacteraceae bacterium]|nr:hypothetical protein [Ktedonobacteraceae bacterium]
MTCHLSRKALLGLLLLTTLCVASACGSVTSGTTAAAGSPNAATSTATATQSVIQKLLLTPEENRDCAAQVPVSVEDVTTLLQETFTASTGGYPANPLTCTLRGTTTRRQVTIQFITRGSNDAYWKEFAANTKQLAGGSDYQDFTLRGADAAFAITKANHGEIIFKKGSNICDVIVSTLDVQSPGNTPATDQAKQLAQLFAERL